MYKQFLCMVELSENDQWTTLDYIIKRYHAEGKEPCTSCAQDAGNTRGVTHRGDMVQLSEDAQWTALGHIYIYIYTKPRRSDRRRRSYHLLRSTLNYDIPQDG